MCIENDERIIDCRDELRKPAHSLVNTASIYKASKELYSRTNIPHYSIKLYNSFTSDVRNQKKKQTKNLVSNIRMALTRTWNEKDSTRNLRNRIYAEQSEMFQEHIFLCTNESAKCRKHNTTVLLTELNVYLRFWLLKLFFVITLFLMCLQYFLVSPLELTSKKENHKT